MNPTALAVYCAAVLLLWIKFMIAITIQARERLAGGSFRYLEDASHWHGTVKADSDLCTRAQALLRNDSEGQIHFFVLGLLYLLVGAWPTGAFVYFPVYALSRIFHSHFLLTARQPHRTRAFGVGIVVLLLLAIHVGIAAASLAARASV